MWLFDSLLSAAFETTRDTFGKISATKTNEVTSAFALHLVGFLIFIPIVALTGIPPLKQGFWIGSVAFLFLTPTWSFLYTYALKNSDLSTVLPMMAFNPVFTALLAGLFQESLDLSGWLGIFL